MNRRHSFSQDRRPPASNSQQNDNRTSIRAGMLRQFRPGISDAWLQSSRPQALVNQEEDTATLRRIATTRPLSSTEGVPKDSRRNAAKGNASLFRGSFGAGQNYVGSSSDRLSLASSTSSAQKLVCPECLMAENNVVALRLHMHRKHFDSSVLLRCPHCTEVIKHMTNLHRHIRVSFLYNTTLLPAIFLNTFVKQKLILILFLKIKHDVKNSKFHCRKCNFTAASEQELERHKAKHRTCPYCRIVMESGTGLAKHMQNCRRGNSFQG